jgi:hypothetical protein
MHLTVYPCAHGHVSTCTWPCILVHMAMYPRGLAVYLCARGHVFMCKYPPWAVLFVFIEANPTKQKHNCYCSEAGFVSIVFLQSITTDIICQKVMLNSIGGHQHWSQCRRYPISDIDICYSDIGDKYVGLKNVIPISEVFRYQHQSSFRYLTLKKKYIPTWKFEPGPRRMVSERYNTELLYISLNLMSDIGYRIKLYSDIRYNVGLRSLSPISEVLISGLVRYRWSRISD